MLFGCLGVGDGGWVLGDGGLYLLTANIYHPTPISHILSATCKASSHERKSACQP